MVNPYDVHTLECAITQAEIMSDGVIDTVFADRGYHGHDYEGGAEVPLAGKKRISRRLKKCESQIHKLRMNFHNYTKYDYTYHVDEIEISIKRIYLDAKKEAYMNNIQNGLYNITI